MLLLLLAYVPVDLFLFFLSLNDVVLLLVYALTLPTSCALLLIVVFLTYDVLLLLHVGVMLLLLLAYVPGDPFLFFLSLNDDAFFFPQLHAVVQYDSVPFLRALFAKLLALTTDYVYLHWTTDSAHLRIILFLDVKMQALFLFHQSVLFLFAFALVLKTLIPLLILPDTVHNVDVQFLLDAVHFLYALASKNLILFLVLHVHHNHKLLD